MPFLDKRRNIDFTISNYLVNTFFKFFTDNKVHLYSTLGNHDTYYRQSIQLDGPSQFASGDYIHIVKDCRVVTFDKTKVALTPWICDENKEEVTNWIVENKNKNTILCGHFELAGFPTLGIHGEVKNMGNAIREFSSIYKINIQYLFAGHLHHNKIEEVGVNQEVINVGSIIGIDDYSLSLRKTSNASAKLLIFEQNKGKVCEYTLKLN